MVLKSLSPREQQDNNNNNNNNNNKRHFPRGHDLRANFACGPLTINNYRRLTQSCTYKWLDVLLSSKELSDKPTDVAAALSTVKFITCNQRELSFRYVIVLLLLSLTLLQDYLKMMMMIEIHILLFLFSIQSSSR